MPDLVLCAIAVFRRHSRQRSDLRPLIVYCMLRTFNDDTHVAWPTSYASKDDGDGSQPPRSSKQNSLLAAGSDVVLGRRLAV
jgi:hypothetical protein